MTTLLAAEAAPVTRGLYALATGLGWAYNLGLKSLPASGLTYLLGFGLILLAVAPARGTGRGPWPAATGIAAIRIILFAAGGGKLS